MWSGGREVQKRVWELFWSGFRYKMLPMSFFAVDDRVHIEE